MAFARIVLAARIVALLQRISNALANFAQKLGHRAFAVPMSPKEAPRLSEILPQPDVKLPKSSCDERDKREP
jgi:hypothetical protein